MRTTRTGKDTESTPCPFLRTEPGRAPFPNALPRSVLGACVYSAPNSASPTSFPADIFAVSCPTPSVSTLRQLTVVVTEHGKSAGVIMGPEMFGLLAERLHVLEKIALGEMEIAAGNHVDWEQGKAGLQKWKR